MGYYARNYASIIGQTLVGCQENREKPEITEPTNPIQCRPHDLDLE